MPKAPFGDILQYLRSMYPADDAGDRTDGELLNRFVTLREKGAFTVLVQRHGPMVLGVCQHFAVVSTSRKTQFRLLSSSWHAGLLPSAARSAKKRSHDKASLSP